MDQGHYFRRWPVVLRAGPLQAAPLGKGCASRPGPTLAERGGRGRARRCAGGLLCGGRGWLLRLVAPVDRGA